MKGQFLLSTLTEFPQLKSPQGIPFPEVVLAGRSNVGKSSLINHLFGQKKLAKTSSMPGKTQLLNFFLIDEKFILVDLPGFGFAQAPGKAVEKWSQAIDTYLNTSPYLRLILLLVDIRREIQQEELNLMEWAATKQIPLWIIFTKADKLSPPEIEKRLQNQNGFSYSIKDSSSRTHLEKRIRQFLWG